MHSLEVSKLQNCASSIREDQYTFGIECVKNFVRFLELDVRYKSVSAQIREESMTASGNVESAYLVVRNATLVTMHHGNEEQDVLEGAVLVVRDGVFESVGREGDVSIPQGAKVIDANQG